MGKEVLEKPNNWTYSKIVTNVTNNSQGRQNGFHDSISYIQKVENMKYINNNQIKPLGVKLVCDILIFLLPHHKLWHTQKIKTISIK